MRTSFIAALSLATLAAASNPLSLKDAKPVLYQPDCDPTFEECEVDMEATEDMEMEEEEEEESANVSILKYAVPASLMQLYAGFILVDIADAYSISVDLFCLVELITETTCNFGTGIMGDVQTLANSANVSLLYALIALVGAFVPAIATPVSYISMGMALNGLYVTIIKLGLEWKECTAAVVTSDYYCTPKSGEETTYALNVDPNKDTTNGRALIAMFVNFLTAGLGFLMFSAQPKSEECAEGDEDCMAEGMWEVCEDEYGEVIDCPAEECLDYYGEVIDCPEEEAEDDWY